MGAMATALRERARGRWPAPGTIHGRWTASDLETLPDDGLRYEIIDGTLLVSPPPIKRHQWVSHRLGILLHDACPAGIQVFVAPLDWRVDDGTVVEPDLLLVPRDDIDVPVHSPVLLVEIASPSSKRIDRTLKHETYARAGVPQYWIVDPGSRDRAPSVEVYDLAGGEYRRQVRVTGDESAAVSGPVPVTVTPTDLIK